MAIKATEADIPRLVRMGKKFHTSSQWANRYEYSEEGAAHYLSRLINHSGSTVIINDHGMIGGSMTPVPFLSMRMAQEAFWWAEKRGLSLLLKFEEWARDMGADYVCMMSLAGGCDRIERLYLHRGYIRSEKTFMKAL